MPLIRGLACKALEDRHWDAISASVGRPINPAEEDVTLLEALEWGLGAPAALAAIEDVAAQAGKEHALKAALEAMRREWDGVVFTLKAYKATGTSVLKGTDEVNALLDDQLVKTQVRGGCGSVVGREGKWVCSAASGANHHLEFQTLLQRIP